MKLLVLPNKLLRLPSEDVELPLGEDDKTLAEAMINYIDDSNSDESKVQAGVGLAAIQFGKAKRMFYINIPSTGQEKGLRDLLINPQVVATSPNWIALEDGEGCLSIDIENTKAKGLVHRKFKILIKAYSYFQQKIVEYKLTNYPAIVVQHELDHLDGKLFIDRIDQKNPWGKKDGQELI